jgi:hypothetical protein
MFYRNDSIVIARILALIIFALAVLGAIYGLYYKFIDIFIIFIVFAIVIVLALVYPQKYKIENGEIIFYRTFSFKKVSVKISSIPTLMIAAYCFGSGHNSRMIKTEDGIKYLPYVVLLNTEIKIWLLEKWRYAGAIVSDYTRKERVYDMQYEKASFCKLIEEGFVGKIYISDEMYFDYKQEFDEIFKSHGIDLKDIEIYESKIVLS